ncbi:MAG: alpha/beta hydrolase [Solirubrobacteraceae bacterium]|nr:alpha/beta hydrolase [Patulibacter sp.]
MGEEKYARERLRSEAGGLVERTFGPSSPRSRRMARVLRLTMYRTVGAWRPTSRGIHLARRAFDPGATWPPMRGTKFQRRVIGGVPVEWSVAPRAQEAGSHARVILYLHGGGFVVGSPRTHRNIVSRLSHVTATAVASVDYRMAPEASIQASRADAYAVYKSLIESGYPAEGIVIAGDSAGGNLATYVTLAAMLNDLGTPAALVLLSPWLDLTTGGPSRTANAGTEFFIGGTVLDRIARVLVPDDDERHFWFNSPINAPEELLSAMPPTLIQVGGAEVLADDGVEMARRIGAAGGARVELQTYDDQGHVVALWAGTPEARRAIREIGVFLRASLPKDLAFTPPTDAEIDEAAEATSPTDVGVEGFPG